MSTLACRTAPEGHGGPAGAPARTGLARALAGSDAHLPRAQKGASGICTLGESDRLRREAAAQCQAPKGSLLNFSEFG